MSEQRGTQTHRLTQQGRKGRRLVRWVSALRWERRRRHTQEHYINMLKARRRNLAWVASLWRALAARRKKGTMKRDSAE